jgi:hypothetical protein
MHFLANRLAEDRDFEEAISLLEEAKASTTADGEFPNTDHYRRIVADLARIEFYAGHCESSLQHAKESMQLNEMSVEEFHKLCAMNLVVMRRWDEADAHLGKLKSTEDVLVQTMLSMVLDAQGRVGAAEAAQSRAEAIDSSLSKEFRAQLSTEPTIPHDASGSSTIIAPRNRDRESRGSNISD